jgi:hypothetical protein
MIAANGLNLYFIGITHIYLITLTFLLRGHHVWCYAGFQPKP